MAGSKLLIADHIYTPDGFVHAQGIVLDTTIRALGTPEALAAAYPDAQVTTLPPHTVLYPGLINPHVHLEFSANRTDLIYGDFMAWLSSVIRRRDDLIARCDTETMRAATDAMLRSGITSFGAVSSFGRDLEACRTAPQRVTYYNELIGSSAATADALYGDFLGRLEAASDTRPHERITPAVAIHAPYSVHPVLLRKALALVRERGLPLSTHFLESPAEREWLEERRGDFLPFFREFFQTDTPVTTVDAFMHAFDHTPALFVHCTQTTEAQREHLAHCGHTIVHCPRSNRLLGCGRLPVESAHAPIALATDGLSSNDSLSLWDEMRAALMLHAHLPLPRLAEQLIRSVTSDAAHGMGSDAGSLRPGAPADLIAIQLPDAVDEPDQIALQSILHTREASRVYIAGERYI